MITYEKISQITAQISQIKAQNKTIAFVPTMGALHAGHLSLIKKAKEVGDVVIVSIFVNKAQFNDANDYQKYPRQFSTDLNLLEQNGADYVFLPDENEIYNANFSFKINVTNYTNILCAATRPGHFDGVALIITKLFNIIKPNFAIFGLKDFQQVLIIKKLVRDFNFDVQIIEAEIMREKTGDISGLAMSSRNQRLDAAAQIKAAQIYKILQEIKNEIKPGENFENILQEKQKKLLEIGFYKIDYLEIRDEENLQLLQKIDQEKKFNLQARIFIAIYLNDVRLIDNLKL